MAINNYKYNKIAIRIQLLKIAIVFIVQFFANLELLITICL